MIIVKLIGGLGNQLFQYAVGRCLSHLHNTELKLDRTYLDADPSGAYVKRDYELDVFTINPVFASREDVKPFLKKSGASATSNNGILPPPRATRPRCSSNSAPAPRHC